MMENIGQAIMVAVVDFSSEDAKIAKQSKKLVEDTLPGVAKGLFMGMVVGYVNARSNPTMMKNMNVNLGDLP